MRSSGTGGRHRRRGAGVAPRGLRQDHRLRHGRHVDRRHALRRRIRARVRNAGGGRAPARADDAHPHGGRGRRIDLPLRRRADPRGPGVGRRQSGPGLVPARRTADGDRLQRDGRQAPSGSFPEGVRSERRPAARCRTSCAKSLRRWRRKSPRGWARNAPRKRSRRIPAHRRRQHGQCDQADLGAARLRRDRIHAELLRRRGRPACVHGRRCAGHDAGVHPSAGGRAVRVRDGACRRARAAPESGRGRVVRGIAAGGDRSSTTNSPRRRAPKFLHRAFPRTGSRCGARCISSTTAPIRRWKSTTRRPVRARPTANGWRRWRRPSSANTGRATAS